MFSTIVNKNSKRFFSSLPKNAFIQTKDHNSPTAQFPDLKAKELRRGSGGRSSFNGHVVTVFGGNGFLGKYLVNKVAKDGAQVILPFRGDFYEIQRLKVCGDLGQVLFSPFHLKDEESIYKALKYSNVCINLIGKETETNNFPFQEVHVDGARRIARVCREVGVKRLIHVSSLNASPQPRGHILPRGSNWLKSKYFGELAVREEFPEATIIKCADVHGADDKFSQYYCKWQRRQYGKVALYKGGFGTYKAPVYVSDVAQAIKNAITDEEAIGETYAAIGPKLYELRSLVEYINRIIQKAPEDDWHVTNLTWAPLFLLRTFIFSNPKWLFKYPEISFEKLERECVSDVLPDNMKTIEELGVKLTSIEDVWEYNLMHWKRMSYYGEEVGEIPELEKPKPIASL